MTAMDTTLHILLSAYADGELDSAAAQALEARLAAEPALQQQLAAYLRLDLAAKAESVPNIFEKRNAQPFRTTLELVDGVTTSAELQLEAAARAMPIPTVTDEKFGAAWKAIARHNRNYDAVTKVMALDDGELHEPLDVPAEMNDVRRAWQILDKAVSRMATPAMSDAQTREAWDVIAIETVSVPEQSGATIDLIEEAARNIVAPTISAARFDGVWKNITAATAVKPASVDVHAADPVPQVTEQKWDSVWSEIKRKTSAEKSVIHADFSPAARASEKHGWSWGVAAALAVSAAAVAFVLSMGPVVPTVESVAIAPVRIPDIEDDRYELELHYLDNQAQPVVCLFLKDEAVASAKPDAGFKWMPE
jgi:hypothetical protein